jgi:hypothetical protein
MKRAACASVLLAVLAAAAPARAQLVHEIANNALYGDYLARAHAIVLDGAAAPQFEPGSPWANLEHALTRGQRGRDLYLLGSERLSLSPSRVGILGWGVSAVCRF